MSQLLQFCLGYWLYIHNLFANLEALYLKKLQGLKVAGRFNSKLGDLGRRLGSYDTAISRASNIGRDLGIGSEYITNKRRGGD